MWNWNNATVLHISWRRNFRKNTLGFNDLKKAYAVKLSFFHFEIFLFICVSQRCLFSKRERRTTPELSYLTLAILPTRRLPVKPTIVGYRLIKRYKKWPTAVGVFLNLFLVQMILLNPSESRRCYSVAKINFRKLCLGLATLYHFLITQTISKQRNVPDASTRPNPALVTSFPVFINKTKTDILCVVFRNLLFSLSRLHDGVYKTLT